MKKLILFSVLAVACVACGSKAGDPASEADSTMVADLPDSLNSEEAVVRRVKAVYDYLDSWKEGQPSADERFGTKEWKRQLDEVYKVDSECECGGFFDFGDEGPVSAWTYEFHEGGVFADSIRAKLLSAGKADVSFLLKDAKHAKGTPIRWLMCVEDGEWRVSDIVLPDSLHLASTMKEYVRYSQFEKTFDFSKYEAAMQQDAYPRFNKSADDVRFKDYAFVDIDGDGLPEVWVRGDEGQDFQAVYSISGDSVCMLASADTRSQIVFYKGAVGYDGYYGDGRVCRGGTIVRNSAPAESYEMEYVFNIFSEEQEMLHETYFLNNKMATAEACEKFADQLGDSISVTPAWHAVPSYAAYRASLDE